MRKIKGEGHAVYVVSPIERRYKQPTKLLLEDNSQILRVRTLNIQKTNIIEKGIGTIIVERQFKTAIKKYWQGIKFDLLIYSTPPITFTNIIKYIKKRDSAKTYLLLKDIFPQNAVDLGMIKAGSLLHRYFKQKEAHLYSISDRIGCMSPANVDYLCKNNPEINTKKVHVNPNSIELIDRKLFEKSEKEQIRNKYNIPENATVLIYGGNLGKPQGIGFLKEIISHYSKRTDLFFLIVGSGTEYNNISDYFTLNKPINALLLPYLQKNKFDDLLAIANVGLIFLDKRFTIPNFPSRLLSYLEFSLPVIAATDKATDIGKIAMDNEFGYWCENGDIKTICNHIDLLSKNNELQKNMGKNGYEFLKSNYLIDFPYKLIFG
jgi:glycosyltransferase involved in cell wall biosynthesis